MISQQAWVGILMAGAMVLAGCGEPPRNAAPGGGEAGGHDHEHGHDHDHAHGNAHDHSAWWCSEHGVPEHLCGLCSPKLAAEMKAKNDWCKEHDRPDSQCFICHPDYEEHFVELYKAKFGKLPEKAKPHDKAAAPKQEEPKK